MFLQLRPFPSQGLEQIVGVGLPPGHANKLSAIRDSSVRLLNLIKRCPANTLLLLEMGEKRYELGKV